MKAPKMIDRISNLRLLQKEFTNKLVLVIN